jgi:KRAB domain-containing zinc finger protein
LPRLIVARAKCEDCSAYFATANLYAKHVKTVHEDYRPHVCEDCARSFKVKKHLESHRRTHTGEKSFQCRHCEKSFAKEWTRTQHERLHLGLKPYQCDVCDARYSQKTSLDCHVRTHHKSI